MPTLKEKPVVTNPAPNTKTAEDKLKEQAEKQKLADNKLLQLEKVGERISKGFNELKEIEGKVEGKMWKLVDLTAEVVLKEKLEGKDINQVLVIGASKAYGLPTAEFKNGGKGATYMGMLSKIKKIAVPSSDLAKQIVEKERAKGTGFNAIYKLLSKPQANPATGGNGDGDNGEADGTNDKTSGKGKKSYTIKEGDEPSLKAALTAVLEAALDAGFSYDQIDDIFRELAIDHQAKAEAAATAVANGESDGAPTTGNPDLDAENDAIAARVANDSDDESDSDS